LPALIADLPRKHRSWPYVAPFAVFVLLLALGPRAGLGPEVHYPLRIGATTAALLLWSRKVLNFRVSNPAGSVFLGLAVFAIWIAPDALWPGYRSHWLFQNVLTGEVASSLGGQHRTSLPFLLLRAAGLMLVVPVVEELFWRAWLMRYLIARRFEEVPLGAYARSAFWISAVLFASEHGPFWDVGLIAGAAYNWWMVRTRSLGDCILAHAVTNACLGAYVLFAGRWEYLF